MRKEDMFEIGAIDRTLPFVPPHITPLPHTKVYHLLPEPARLRYNQIMASCYHEHFIHLERMLTEHILPALIRLFRGRPLESKLRMFADEERQHTAWFHALHQASEPELYQENYHYFVRPPLLGQKLLEACARRPALFPFCLWITMIIEERTIAVAREMLQSPGRLEPHYVNLHRLHAADEARHVGCDAEALRVLWPRLSPLNRRFNKMLFVVLLREFFRVPKRAGWAVILRLVHEHPQLEPLKPRMRRELRALARNHDYLRTLYVPEREPRTFSLAREFPDFGDLERQILY